jgi:transcriptional regulator with XRE-family HTH domain
MTTFKQARQRARIGLREFARDAGVSKDILLRVENSPVGPERINYGDVVRIARAARRAGLTKAQVEDLFPVSDVVA